MVPQRKINPEDKKLLPILIQEHTLKEIGQMYGLSRERIRQILKAMGITPPRRKRFKTVCSDCKKEYIFTKRAPEPYKCRSCRYYDRIHANNPKVKFHRRKFEKPKICPICNKRPVRTKGICQQDYVKNKLRTDPVYREKNRIRTKKYYLAHKAEIYKKVRPIQKAAYLKKTLFNLAGKDIIAIARREDGKL